jgi:hypothetical protein
MTKLVDEGSWFAVPLRVGGFAVGLVARTAAAGGVILAYFFRQKWPHVPSLNDVVGMKPASAAKILRVGDLSLVDGTWPIIGRTADWQRSVWPVPTFVRKDPLSRRAWAVRYADHDANIVESEAPTEYITDLDPDAVLGAGAAEIILTRTVGQH